MAEDIPSRWLSADEQKLWRSYLCAHFRLTKALNEDMEKTAGFDHLTYEIFVNLSESKDHSIRMSDLAKSVSASKSRLTYRIEQLEKEGLVIREACEEDGRGQWCVLTKKGYKSLVEAAPHHVQAVLENFIDPISGEDLENLVKIFDSIAETVQTKTNLKK